MAPMEDVCYHATKASERVGHTVRNEEHRIATIANLAFSRLAGLPTEVISVIASLLKGSNGHQKYLLNLRKTSKTMQEKTLPYFCEWRFHTLVIRVGPDHPKELEMILYFLEFGDVARTVSALGIYYYGEAPLDSKLYYGLFSQVLAKLSKDVVLRIAVSRCFESTAYHKPAGYTLMTDFIRALTSSQQPVSSLQLRSAGMDSTALRDFIISKRDSLSSIESTSTMVLGGPWDNIFRACLECPRPAAFVIDEARFSDERRRDVVITFRDKRLFAPGGNIVRAVRSSSTGTIEVYRLGRYEASCDGPEAVRLGLLKMLE